ncbi:hypothetical protein [Streptomyces sp. NPDC008150]|uniref:hypothetical protein n=1 Tax=Streptomyces sp. NPDC008150 TaxID=3364816 RepID=UPI0036E3A685
MITSLRRGTVLSSVALVASVIAPAVAGHAETATARNSASSVSRAICDGKSQNTTVKVYKRGATSVPLRCGTSTWGFRHVQHRWNDAFDREIALAVSRGESNASHTIYITYRSKCKEHFRVVVNHGALNGKGVAPQGVITAYHRVVSGAAGAERAAGPCGVLESI